MKTFQQFCENAYQLNEFNVKSVPGKIGRSAGAEIAGEVIKKGSKIDLAVGRKDDEYALPVDSAAVVNDPETN